MARPFLRVVDGEPDPAQRAARLAARGYSAGAALRVVDGEPDPAQRAARLAARGYSAGAALPLSPPSGRAKPLGDGDLTPADVLQRRLAVLNYLGQLHDDDGAVVRDALAYAADLVALELFGPEDPTDAPGSPTAS